MQTPLVSDYLCTQTKFSKNMEGDMFFTPSLFNQLSQKDVDFESIKSQILEAYNLVKSKTVIWDFATDNEKKDIIDWFKIEMLTRSFHFAVPLKHMLHQREVPVTVPLFSPNLTTKVTSLAQFHCPICKARNQFPVIVKPIPITPESKQALAKTKGLRAAYENSIRGAFNQAEMQYMHGQHLCVLVVFVMANGKKGKDLDNMSKALMDALQGYLFANDADIDHLNLFKIRHENPESFIYVNIRRTDLNEHQDVFHKRFDHKMMVKDVGADFEAAKQALKVLRKTPKGK